MRLGRLSALGLATVVMSLVSYPAAAAPAQAAVGEADQISSLVSEAAEIAGVTAAEDARADSAAHLSTDPNAPISIVSERSASFDVSLPSNVSLGRGVVAQDGTVVYAGEPGSPDVAVEALAGGVRVSTVLNTDTSARSFDYSLPEGVTAALDDSGRVELTRSVEIEADGTEAIVSAVIGYIEPAWARDASGTAVETDYEIGQGLITQHVRTTATTVYPVVADPQWSTTAWNQVRVRWNRAETATIASGGWGATAITGICAGAGAAIGGPAGGAGLAAACLTVSGAAVYTAGVAQNSNPRKCLEMFATYTFIAGPGGWVPWFGTYSGGNCR